MSGRFGASIAQGLLVLGLVSGSVAIAKTVPRANVATAQQAASDVAVLRARFVQMRTVDGFRHPLRSEGEVLLVRGAGLRWEVHAPFRSVTIVHGGRLRLIDAEGRTQDLGEDTGASVSALMQSLLDALLSADRVALAKRFEVAEVPPRSGAWALVLTPKERVLAQVFRGIDVEGSTHVERIRLRERSGAEAIITFHDTRTQPAAGEAERRAFE